MDKTVSDNTGNGAINLSTQGKNVSNSIWDKSKNIQNYALNILDGITNELINIQDKNHIFLHCNSAFTNLIWISRENIIWKRCTEIFCSEHWCIDNCPIEALKKWKKKSFVKEINWEFYEKTADEVYDDNKVFIWYVEKYRNCTDTILQIRETERVKKLLENQLRLNEALISAIPNFLFVLDIDLNFKLIHKWNSNDYLWDMTFGKNIRDFFDNENSNIILDAVIKTIETWESQNMEYFLYDEKWEKHYFYSSSNFLSDNQIVMTSKEITDKKLNEHKILHLAMHDSLTGLPNRVNFYENLKLSVLNAKRNRKEVELFFMDLDFFKKVNDTYWHEIWDLLLIEVTNRLKKCVRTDDIIARMWWDEFALLIATTDKKQNYEIIADKIINTISTPFIIKWKHINVWISIWVSVYFWETDSQISVLDIKKELLRHADMAMYQAKKSWWNTFKLYK